MKYKTLWIVFCALQCNSWGNFWTISGKKELSITAINPAVGSTNNATQSSVTVSFNSAVAASSATTNATDTTCTGNIQMSVNNFDTCIRLRAANLSSDGTRLTLDHVGIPNGQSAKVRVTTAVVGAAGETMPNEYTSGSFSIVNPPCGTGNCYQSMSSVLGTTVGGGSHFFRLHAGANSGHYAYVVGSISPTVRILNTQNFTTSLAPFSLTQNADAGAHTITILSGVNTGQHLIVHANSGATTTRYNAQTGVASVGPTLAAAVGAGAHSIAFSSGSRQGKYWIVNANGSAATSTFDPDAFTLTSNTAFGSTILPGGPLSFFVNSGVKTGESFTFRGNGSTQGYFSDNPGTVRSTVSSPNLASGGAQIAGGNRKNQFFIASGTGGNTQIYNPVNDVFSLGPATGALGIGSCVIALRHGNNANKIFVALGSSSMTTLLYDPETNTIGAGANLPVMLVTESFCTTIEGGLYPDAILIPVGVDIILFFP